MGLIARRWLPTRRKVERGDRISRPAMSRAEMDSPAEHRALAEILLEAKGMVVLSGYPSELYSELYEARGRRSTRRRPHRAIRLGTPAHGVCSACGAPWQRQIERSIVDEQGSRRTWRRRTLGWEPSCACGEKPVPATVLDPFAGTGTSGVAAVSHGRSFIGIDADAGCCALMRERLRGPIFSEGPAQGALFAQPAGPLACKEWV